MHKCKLKRAKFKGVHCTNDKKKFEMNQKEREYFVSSQRKSYQAV